MDKKKTVHEEHRERATAFYKKVIRWHRQCGLRHKTHRKAAIGLPDAVKAGAVIAHAREFVRCARRDGVPVEALIHFAHELRRELGEGAKR